MWPRCLGRKLGLHVHMEFAGIGGIFPRPFSRVASHHAGYSGCAAMVIATLWRRQGKEQYSGSAKQYSGQGENSCDTNMSLLVLSVVE